MCRALYSLVFSFLSIFPPPIASMKLGLARISNNAPTASFPIYDNSHFRCTLRTNINPYSVFDKEIWIPSQIFPSIWCITKCHTL